MNIKMSEVFELPVKKTQGGVLPFLKDCNPMCNSIFVGSDNHVDATVIAINAYDANQLEIAELKQLAETKNARTLERIGRIEQQEREISELKAMILKIKEGWEIYGETGFDDALFVIEDTPAQCLQSEKADAKKKGARTFRDEMLAASKCILHPHIEGVFAVYESKFDKMIEAEQLREGKS